jgi:hypothetical protein
MSDPGVKSTVGTQRTGLKSTETLFVFTTVT